MAALCDRVGRSVPRIQLAGCSKAQITEKQTKNRGKKTPGLKTPTINKCPDSRPVNPICTDWPHVTQVCGLCCFDETTVKLIYCDSVLPITAVTMQFLPLPGSTEEVRCSHELLTTLTGVLLTILPDAWWGRCRCSMTG